MEGGKRAGKEGSRGGVRVYLGVGYGKMDRPNQRAIYHCQKEQEREREEKVGREGG